MTLTKNAYILELIVVQTCQRVDQILYMLSSKGIKKKKKKEPNKKKRNTKTYHKTYHRNISYLEGFKNLKKN